MNLSEYKNVARALLDQHGLTDWSFAFHRRKRHLGTCYNNRKLICVSEFHAIHDSEELVRETILHEIAHALAGAKVGHGYIWQSIAARIGCKEIVRCGRGTDQYHREPGTWYAVCPGCLKIYYWYRKPKGVRGGITYHCLKCGKNDGRLIPVENKTTEQVNDNQNVSFSQKLKGIFD